MGLFNKVKKGGKAKNEEVDVDVETFDDDSTDEKPAKKKRKGLGGVFGRKKSDKGIIDSMGLNEAVASMGLSVLEDVVEAGEPSAVRKLNDGYTAIALTEDMLQNMDIDLKSADFGSFANAINSEHIESLLLENDLHNGILVLIPDQDTLDVLSEFSFLNNTVYRWAVVPYDVEDDSTVVLLENGATLKDLSVIADEGVDLTVKNGQIVVASGGSDESDDDLDSDDESYDEFDEFGEDDDDFGDDDVFGDITGDINSPDSGGRRSHFDDEDDFDDFDFDDDGFDDVSSEQSKPKPYAVLDMESDDDVDEFSKYDEDDDFDFDEDTSDDLDVELDMDDDFDDDLDDLLEDSEPDVAMLQDVEDGREMIQGVLDREFNNDELDIMIKGDAFNQQFGDVHVMTFDEEPLDSSDLSMTVSEMRRDANTRLHTLHNNNMQKLRSHYQNGLSEIHDKLVDILDYKDSDTAFGGRYSDILSEKEEKEEMADELVAQNREKLDRTYESKRDSYAERAKREAMARFDDQNKNAHDAEKRRLGDEVATNIQLGFDSELADLYDDRRNVAKRIFDKMTTGLLLEIQKIHEENVKTSQELYEKFHSEIDTYTRQNYTDEVMRAKAMATQQRQHHEADEVRAEYEQMLTSKTRQLEEAERKAEAELRKLEDSHSKSVSETVSEYKRQVARREEEIKELRNNNNRLQDKIINVSKEKEEEFSQRLRTNADTIESQRQQISYEQERADKQSKQSGVLLAGMVVVGVALGLIGGFLIGAQRSEPVQQAPAAQESSVGQPGMIDVVSSSNIEHVLNMTFNHLFADDTTLVQ